MDASALARLSVAIVTLALAGCSDAEKQLPPAVAGAYRTLSATCGPGGPPPSARAIRDVRQAIQTLGEQAERTPTSRFRYDESDRRTATLRDLLTEYYRDPFAEARCQEVWPLLRRYLSQ